MASVSLFVSRKKTSWTCKISVIIPSHQISCPLLPQSKVYCTVKNVITSENLTTCTCIFAIYWAYFVFLLSQTVNKVYVCFCINTRGRASEQIRGLNYKYVKGQSHKRISFTNLYLNMPDYRQCSSAQILLISMI
jgi:hypothetical protein